MTSPAPAPRGADAAQERNAAAVRRLDDDARPSVGAAIHEMLGAVLTSLDSGPQTPSVESLTSAARSAWRTAVDRILGWVRATFARLVGRAADNLPDDTAPVIPPRTLEQRVDGIAAQVAGALSEVPDVLASRVVTALREGWARGEAPEQLQARVAAVLGRDQWDAEIERIVRTTTTTVYNAAHAAAADALEAELGTPLRRIWLATRDGRTRPTHRAAHAQVVDSGQPFIVGGHRLRYPGDPLAPPQETVMCRCVVAPVVDDLVIDLAHRVQGQEADVLTDLAEQNEPDATTAAADGVAGATRMPPQLVTYWTRGEGAARIRWGTEGDFTRCARALRRYLDVGEVNGACANLHRRATGKWPAEKGSAVDMQEDEMPCPCESTPEPAAGDAAVTAVTLEETNRLAMLALIPSEADAARLAVDGGLPPEELHVTVLFLGTAERWEGTPEGERMLALAARIAEDIGPIRARLWARSEINPESDEPVAAYMVGDDAGRLAELQAGLLMATDGLPVPAQFAPYVPHLSTRYESSDLAGMDATGTEMVLDRIRVDIGTQAVDFPLTGDDDLDSLDDDVEAAVMVDDAAPVALDDPPADAAAVTEVTAAAAVAVDDPAPAVVPEPSTAAARPKPTARPKPKPPARAGRSTVSARPAPPPRSAPPRPAAPPAPAEPAAPVVAAAPAEPAAPVVAAEPGPRAAVVEGAVVASQIRAADDVLTVVAQAAANAPSEPPRAWFEPIEVDGPTPPTITAEGRVWGHIGQAGVCHAGIADRCVTIPPTRTNFGAFHRGEMLTAEGDAVQVGYLYTGCDHSGLDLTMDEARAHLDAACVRTAVGRVYNDPYGPMFVGALVPGVTAEDVRKLYKLSGEWFTAPLELHAAIGVDDAGFPVDGTGDSIRVSEVDPAPLAAARVAAAVVDEIERRTVVREAEAIALAAARRTAARAARVVTGYQRRGQ